MHSFYDYKKFAILYVDDEEQSLRLLPVAFAQHFRILTASNAQAAFKILQEHADEIGILMTDQRMPGEKGVQLLEKARQLRPRILRILVTAYSDIDAAISAVNTGAIYKYFHKPWEMGQLEQTFRRGLEFFIVQRERDQLLREKLSVLHNLMVTDRVVSLGVLAAGLGHHLRNALVAVRTFLDLAPQRLQEEKVDLDELRNPDFWKDFYDHVQSQIVRITGMLNDLGGASHLAAEPFRDEVDLGDVIGKVLEKAKEKFFQKHIVVKNEIPDSLPKLTVDAWKFHRIFELLLTDELVSLPEGSRIVIKARSLTPPAGGAPEVQVEISDNGPGLPEAALRSVFDPFFVRSDNPQEFGINLMTCYFLVYHHGGRIEVKGRDGKGTSFLVTLPTNPQAHDPAQEEKDFLPKVLLNDRLWEKLLSNT